MQPWTLLPGCSRYAAEHLCGMMTRTQPCTREAAASTYSLACLPAGACGHQGMCSHSPPSSWPVLHGLLLHAGAPGPKQRRAEFELRSQWSRSSLVLFKSHSGYTSTCSRTGRFQTSLSCPGITVWLRYFDACRLRTDPLRDRMPWLQLPP